MIFSFPFIENTNFGFLFGLSGFFFVFVWFGCFISQKMVSPASYWLDVNCWLKPNHATLCPLETFQCLPRQGDKTKTSCPYGPT